MIVIDAESVSVSLPNKPLFTNVSLTVSDGDRVGVVGLNGTGKSTLLRVLAGRSSPTPVRCASAGAQIGRAHV